MGERHPDTAKLLSNVGTQYRALGDHQRALEYGEKALAIQRELLGERHPNTIRYASNVAEMLSYLNRGPEAFQLVDKLIRNLPKDHPGYHLLKQQRQRLLSKPLRPGFRQPSGKKSGQRGKDKKRQ